MRFLFPLSILTLLFIKVIANDGTYRSNGSIIYPVNETKITLNREILSFTCNENSARVDIYFEFNNPEQVDRKLLVGFQAPMAYGDVSLDDKIQPGITDFIIMSNGKILPYQLKVAKCEDCELMDTSSFTFEEGASGIFVFLFEMNFKPGLNKINHSYEFRASSNVEISSFYKYILTTGAKWANKEIEDFTLQIDMGLNKYFYVGDIFGIDAQWDIIGSGKVTEKYFSFLGPERRMIRVLSGKLQIALKHFKPTENLEFGILYQNTFLSGFLDDGQVPGRITAAAMLRETDLSDFFDDDPLTKDDYLILRNLVYAQHGYYFKMKELFDYFSKFDWYIPNPNLTTDKIVLSAEEKKFINEITAKEKNK